MFKEQLKGRIANKFPNFYHKSISYYNSFLMKRGKIEARVQPNIVPENELLLKEQIKSYWHQIDKEIIPARDYLYHQEDLDSFRLGGGYFAHLKDDLIIASNGRGEMFTYQLKEKKLNKLKTNLNDIYIKADYKGKIIPGVSGYFGVKDIFFDKGKNRILASMNSENSDKKNCYGISIYTANLPSEISINNINKLNFSEFFQTKSCNYHWKGHASGGRIKRLKENIIFTVGDMDMNETGLLKTAQSPTNEVGKVLSISDDGSYKVLSMGHRNQQGLTIVNNKIFITEHGPTGGDEVNIIKPDKPHYGWPFFSHGFNYNRKILHRYTHTGEYSQPLYYFSPTIAISEIVFYEGNEFPRWKNKFIVSSLKNKSLYLLDYDEEAERIISSERINIGHRIRDLGVLPSGKLFIVTDDQNLILLSKSIKEEKEEGRYYGFLKSSPKP
tara:strand:+ start:2373 stop:3698 length:1326 start_codon:yes stop_codon:yes gene_type:complete